MRMTWDSTAFTSDPVDLARAVFVDPEQVRDKRRRALKWILGLSVLAFAGLFFVSLAWDWNFDRVWRYEAAALFGASVGTAELLSRYRDAPSFVLLSPPGVGYILINAIASVGALGLILAFDWTFGASGDAVAGTQVLLAGFGSMALFRSSLLTVKAGGDDVGIGPSSVLSIMMAASDRSADRLRASERAGRVHQIMANVSYEKARDALPTVAVALMQNLSPADVAGLNSELEGLKNKTLPDETKSLLLGLKITDMVSTAVLAAAKESLGPAILAGPNGADERAEGNDVADTPAPLTPEGPSTGGFASDDLPQTPQTPGPDPVPAARR